MNTVAAQPDRHPFFGSLLPALRMLRKNDPLRMAGATAFFTSFALPPIVFILAQMFGLFLSPREVGRGLIENIGHNLGTDGAEQVRQVIRSIRGFSHSWYVIVFGFLFLIFVATTLFSVIKDSLDDIWKVRIKDHAGIVVGLRSRAKSFGVILFVGILFFADLLLKSMRAIGGEYVEGLLGGSRFYFNILFGELSSVLIVSAWFVILFHYLADAIPRWKACLMGGLLTGILFSAGRVLLRTLLLKGNIGILYGTGGSLVLVLLFVFYTSFIMYYGACFIAVYSEKKGWPVRAGYRAIKK
ncbi:MAG: ribonuclease [Ferruginibacter sp.]|nr:ribonuclease [Ferruginibacter sp.]